MPTNAARPKMNNNIRIIRFFMRRVSTEPLSRRPKPHSKASKRYVKTCMKVDNFLIVNIIKIMNNKQKEKFTTKLFRFHEFSKKNQNKLLETLAEYTKKFISSGTTQYTINIHSLTKNACGWWYVIEEDMVAHIKNGQRHNVDGPAVIYFDDDIDEDLLDPVHIHYVDGDYYDEKDYYKHPLVMENMINKINQL